MSIYKIAQPVQIQRRIAFRNFGFLPIPYIEERRKIEGVARVGTEIDFRGGLRGASVVTGEAVLKGNINNDYGYLERDRSNFVAGSKINGDSELKDYFWYREKEEAITEGIYERLETERRFALTFDGQIVIERRHRLGKKLDTGHHELLREGEDGFYGENGLLGIVLDGSRLQVAGFSDGRYWEEGSVVLEGAEINEAPLAHSKFHLVGSKERSY